LHVNAIIKIFLLKTLFENMKLLGISSPYTSSGKTTVTLALSSMVRNAAVFKIGPDFIDPGLERSITGYAENIDRYLEGKNFWKLVCRASNTYDFAIFEGVMGLYDSGLDFDNSTYYYFKRYRIPHVIVLDVSNMAESAYRVFKGFKNKYTIGVIINNYYGERHLNMVIKDFIKNNVKIFGKIPHSENLKMESRHLGLYTYLEQENINKKINEVKKFIDPDIFKDLPEIECKYEEKISRRNINIAIALDKAFNFYYQYNLDLLSSIGNVSFFSPINDEYIENSHFIYIGGGYPEIYKEQLSNSKRTREWILDHYYEGKNIYGECGGLMYMMEKIGNFKMLGIFNGHVLENAGLTLNYTKLFSDENYFIFKKGDTIFGHEYHYSRIYSDEKTALKVLRGNGINGRDGIFKNNAYGSYTHLHFFRYREKLERYLNKIYKQDSNK